MDKKNREHLKLIKGRRRTEGLISITEEIDFFKRPTTIKEKLQRRGIEAKTIMIGLTAMSMISAVVVLTLLAAVTTML
jgi:hypothetical protein